jgi:hypothetical protein
MFCYQFHNYVKLIIKIKYLSALSGVVAICLAIHCFFGFLCENCNDRNDYNLSGIHRAGAVVFAGFARASRPWRGSRRELTAQVVF